MRLLTWNIQWGRGVDRRVDLARSARAITDFGAEVICLQEVAVNQPRLPGGPVGDQPAELAALFPGYHACYGIGADLPAETGGRSLFGNLILTRRPLLQAFRHLLPWPADPSVASMPRVAVETVIEAPWGPLRVVTCHLEYYSRRQRLAQVDGLRALHAEACGHAVALRPDDDVDAPFAALPRPASAVLCGDFNFPPEAPEYARLLAPFPGAVARWQDAWNLAHAGVAHAPSVGVNGADWPDHPYCCDFFVVTEDLKSRVRRVEVRSDTDASDHQPLLLELED